MTNIHAVHVLGSCLASASALTLLVAVSPAATAQRSVVERSGDGAVRLIPRPDDIAAIVAFRKVQAAQYYVDHEGEVSGLL